MSSTKSKLENLKQIAFISLVVLLLTIAVGTIFSYIDNPWGIKVFTVLTDSMKPTFSKGYLIATIPEEEYYPGDIITYEPPTGRLGGQVVDSVTHRISEIEDVDGMTYYYTKGDANSSQDIDPVTKDLIIGKVFLKIPFIGYLIEFSKTEIGLIVMIIIPGVIIVYDEVKKMASLIKAGDEKQKVPPIS